MDKLENITSAGIFDHRSLLVMTMVPGIRWWSVWKREKKENIVRVLPGDLVAWGEFCKDTTKLMVLWAVMLQTIYQVCTSVLEKLNFACFPWLFQAGMLFIFLLALKDFPWSSQPAPFRQGSGWGTDPPLSLFRQPPAHLPSQLTLSKHLLLTPRVLHLTFAPTSNIFINKRSSNEEGEDGRVQGKNSICKTRLSCLVTTSWYKGDRGGFVMDDMSFARAPSVVASTERGP